MPKTKIAPLYLEILAFLLIVGIHSGVKFYQFSTWEKTTGEVVGLQKENIKTYTGTVKNEIPVIRYLAKDKLYEIKATLLTGISDYWAGDEVQIIYPEKNPQNASVLNFLGFWLPIPNIILMLIGFLVSIGVLRIALNY